MLMEYTILIVYAAIASVAAILPTSPSTLVAGVRVGVVLPLVPRVVTPVCSRIGGECLPDCKTIMACRGSGEPPASTRQCPDDRPYCNTNECTATPDPTNELCLPTTTTKFTCTGAGLYPDPSDCSQYFDCPSENENAVLFRCPDRSVYDSRLQSCAINNGTFFWATPPTAAASRSFLPTPTCLPVTCPRFFVGNLPMRSNPAFYVFCFETTRMVFRCPDPDNQVFDPRLDRQRCSFKCSAAGHFIDRQDCHRFYTCTRRGLLLTVEQHRCPEGYWFSGNKRCELEDTECVPELPMRQ